MRTIYLNSFNKSFENLAQIDQIKIVDIIEELLNILENKTQPKRSFGLKKLRKDLWEARVSIKLIILFKVQQGMVIFILSGEHEQIKRYLKQ